MQVLFQRCFIPAYVLLALTLTLFNIYLCYSLEWRGPMRDLWEFIAIIEQQLHGQWDWQRLLEPYGGIHRIFLPKLLFYLDYRFASGSNLLSLTVTLSLHILACAVFLYQLFLHQGQNSPIAKNFQEKCSLSALVLLFFFSTTQTYNLIYNSDNQVVISNTIAILSAWCFIRHNILLANGLLILACLSHSSSLMLLPAFIIIMTLQQAPKKILLLQIIFSVLLLGLYISGNDPLDNPADQTKSWEKMAGSLLGIIFQLKGIVRYILFHLSSPTSRLWPNVGILLSIISICYLFSILWRIYRKRLVLHEAEKFFLCLALYVFFIAVITACGRQIYPNSAFTDRYQTLVMTYWPALLILLYRDLQRWIPTSLSLLLVCLCSLALLLPHQYNSAREMAWLSSRVKVAHTAATVGITDMNTVAATLSHPLLMDNNNLVARHNDFLREYGLGYFSETGSEYFLNPQQAILLDFTPVKPNGHCTGELFSAETLISETLISDKPPSDHPDHVVMRMRGNAQVAGKAVSTLLIVDNVGQVIGLGKDQRPKGEFRPLSWRPAESTEWIGFIRSTKPLQMPLTFINLDPQHPCELFNWSVDEGKSDPP